MRFMVTIGWRPGSRKTIVARMADEQAHVRKLTSEGVISAIHIAADQSRVWLDLGAESAEHARQMMTEFPLYPVMELELTPLLELATGRTEGASRGR
jgi:muconolactone delta-isomerase